MSTRAHFFGTTVETTHANDPAAIGFAVALPNGGMLRQPQSQRPFFDALASGEPMALSSDQHTTAVRLGIDLQDCTAAVREATAWDQLEAGVDRDVVNANLARIEPHYRAKGVTITTGFKPVSTY